jgi:hypothetical protein
VNTPEQKEANNRTFSANLNNSREAVNFYAGYLKKLGCSIEMPEERLSPNYEQRMEYTDGGDLFTQIGDKRIRLEVKQRRNIEFSGRADYPYQSIMVCAAHSWELADPKPYVYVILNRSLTAAAYILGETSPEWWVEKKTDKRYINYSQRFFFANLDCVKWKRLVT